MECEERLVLKGSQEFWGVVKTGRGRSACLRPRPGCFDLANLPCEHAKSLFDHLVKCPNLVNQVVFDQLVFDQVLKSISFSSNLFDQTFLIKLFSMKCPYPNLFTQLNRSNFFFVSFFTLFVSHKPQIVQLGVRSKLFKS